MRRIAGVKSELRTELKKRIDEVGRQRIAEFVDMRYTTISHKLNGQLPLSQEEYNILIKTCDHFANTQACEYQG